MIAAGLDGKKTFGLIWAVILALVICYSHAGKAPAAEKSSLETRVAAASPVQPNVHGVWFAAGDPQRPCSINQQDEYLRLIDEQGQTSQGMVVGENLIQAYSALGHVTRDGKRIDWENRTYWARAPQKKASKTSHKAVDISGRWYAYGDPGKICRVTQVRDAIQLVNETGRASAGKFIKERVVEAFGQKGYLTKDGTQITWPDSTFWTRQPQAAPTPSPSRPWPDLNGTWYAFGHRNKACTIHQQGNSLTFTNEVGVKTTGRFLDPYVIESHGFKGYLTEDLRRIVWANQTWWSR